MFGTKCYFSQNKNYLYFPQKERIWNNYEIMSLMKKKVFLFGYAHNQPLDKGTYLVVSAVQDAYITGNGFMN